MAFRLCIKTGSADIGNWQQLSAIQVSLLPALKHQTKFKRFA
jgi:hypothetical protein